MELYDVELFQQDDKYEFEKDDRLGSGKQMFAGQIVIDLPSMAITLTGRYRAVSDPTTLKIPLSLLL